MIVSGIAAIGGIVYLVELWLYWSVDVWKTLAQDYSYSGKKPDRVRSHESGMIYYYSIAPTHYKKTLSVAIDSDALYIWLAKPLHPLKKMLRIPFSDLNEIGGSNMYLWKSRQYIVFTTQAQPRIKICLGEDVVARMKSEWNDFHRTDSD